MPLLLLASLFTNLSPGSLSAWTFTYGGKWSLHKNIIDDRNYNHDYAQRYLIAA